MLAKVVTNYPPISSHMDSENRTEIFFWDISLFLSNWTNLSWLDKAYLKVHASSYIKYILCFPYTYICIQVENKCWLLCNVVYPFLKIRSLSWLVIYSITNNNTNKRINNLLLDHVSYPWINPTITGGIVCIHINIIPSQVRNNSNMLRCHQFYNIWDPW